MTTEDDHLVRKPEHCKFTSQRVKVGTDVYSSAESAFNSVWNQNTTMLTTLIPVAIILGFTIVTFFLWSGLLYLGLRWAQAPEITIRGIFLPAIFAQCFSWILWGVSFLMIINAPQYSTDTAAVRAIVMGCFGSWLISHFNSISFKRAFRAYLPTILTALLILVCMQFVVAPYLFRTFEIHNNSMAPTLLGPHHRGTCSLCGAPGYIAVTDQPASDEQRVMICDRFHATIVPEVDPKTYPADEFLVNWLLTPKRWDLVVYAHPRDPSVLMIRRLVGLPGETITIRDGAVWANGQKITPPKSLKPLVYISETQNPSDPALWGSPDQPAKLAEGEYFVLGDFTARCADSRYGLDGGPGQHSYAIPEANLRGVVTHILGPFDRMRILK